MRNLCLDCGSPLGPKATKCRCGWALTETPQFQHIQCAFHDCLNQATVRAWTKTGWANVCVEHYAVIPRVPRVVSNFAMEEVRDAYKKRLASGGVSTDTQDSIERIRKIIERRRAA